MSIENLINNTRPVANGYINDQLKWRKQRIETLELELANLKTLTAKLTRMGSDVILERDKYKKLYKEECEFVQQLSVLLEFMTKTLEKDMGEIPNANKLMDTIKEHINNQKK